MIATCWNPRQRRVTGGLGIENLNPPTTSPARYSIGLFLSEALMISFLPPKTLVSPRQGS